MKICTLIKVMILHRRNLMRQSARAVAMGGMPAIVRGSVPKPSRRGKTLLWMQRIIKDWERTWQQVSSQGFNLGQKAVHGSAVFMEGGMGPLGKHSFSTKYTRRGPGASRPKE